MAYRVGDMMRLLINSLVLVETRIDLSLATAIYPVAVRERNYMGGRRLYLWASRSGRRTGS